MVNCSDVVIDILKKNIACTHRELTDRTQLKHKINNSETNKSITKLYNSGTISRKQVDSPYQGRPFSFYFLPNSETKNVDKTVEYKTSLAFEKSKYNDEVGAFGEDLVAKLITKLEYDKVETRKRNYHGIGLKRMGLDVFGYNFFSDSFQHIEVKNRRQPVGIDDLKHVEEKSKLASELWSISIESALVCSFIYPSALEYATSKNIPVVITGKQFVPEKLSNLFTKVKKNFGSDYILITSLDEIPSYVKDLIEEKILWNSINTDLKSNVQTPSKMEMVDLI